MGVACPVEGQRRNDIREVIDEDGVESMGIVSVWTGINFDGDFFISQLQQILCIDGDALLLVVGKFKPYASSLQN